MEFAGAFETHLTVHLEQADRIDALREWGARHGFKCLHIVLDRGETVSQPMLTRHDHGHLSEVLPTAHRFARTLVADGFPVTRVKLEAALHNADVPASRAEARALPSGFYFEHHVKLLLEPGADTVPLAALAQAHRAHLSRNALRTREDGRLDRFVTQRSESVGRLEAGLHLEALLRALYRQDYAVIDVEQEYVVFDDNPAIDAGWIQDAQEG